MAVPGLFIEYLVNGALALVWAYPVLNSMGLGKIDPSYLPLFALGLYVLGMIIDFFAWILTRPIKRMVRRRISNQYGLPPDHEHGQSIAREVKFSIYAPELARAVMMRSSRDRIARGTFLNSILATLFVLPLSIGIIVIVGSFFMWIGFESVSHKFALKAEQALEQKGPGGARGEGEYV